MGERHVFSREGRCKGCGCTSASATAAQQCPLPADTVRHMVGGETGEAGRGRCPSEQHIEDVPGLAPRTFRCVLDDGHDSRQHRWGRLCDWETTCPAPIPEAP
jgi:hypothetical protein